jgi:hypothetical protein
MHIFSPGSQERPGSGETGFEAIKDVISTVESGELETRIVEDAYKVLNRYKNSIVLESEGSKLPDALDKRAKDALKKLNKAIAVIKEASVKLNVSEKSGQ